MRFDMMNLSECGMVVWKIGGKAAGRESTKATEWRSPVDSGEEDPALSLEKYSPLDARL